MKIKDIKNISKEDLEFAQKDIELHDQKFETKKVGYFKDAISRFGENKGSIVAFVIILILVLFSVITPFVSGYQASTTDPYYTYCLPKNSLFENSNGFWDGTKSEVLNEKFFWLYDSYGAIKSYSEGEDEFGDKQYHAVRDTYVVGSVYKTLTKEQFEDILEFDAKQTNIEDRIMQPLVDTSWIDTSTNNGRVLASLYEQNGNYSYKMTFKLLPIYTTDSEGNKALQYCYKTDANGEYLLYEQSGNTYGIRMNYDNYYIYKHGSKPYYILGSDQYGRDIMTRLAVGGRLSLSLGIIVSLFNIILGVIYGAIEGYYGGTTDIVMERISEILNEVPFMIVVTLFSLYLADKVGPVISLFFAFVVTGWIGTAATVRMQFYRYKGQEYVLAARTLGASDNRLIFKHILPNAIGPIITSSVLMIPSVIFSESSLSYLKIIDFSTGNITSIGTMLSEGQATFMTYPNLILWPAIFISLLMICFNIFGNGLRDAFNPQLRGAE